jgi:hypothetical protein
MLSRNYKSLRNRRRKHSQGTLKNRRGTIQIFKEERKRQNARREEKISDSNS